MSRSVCLGFVVAFGSVALCACEGEPDDPFFFFGTALDAKGAPVAGAPMELLRGKDAACGWSFREQYVPPPVPDGFGQPLDPFQQTATGPDGAFLFEILRYQLDRGYCFRAEMSAGTGAKTIVPFWFYLSDFQVDRFVLWGDGYATASLAADGHELVSADPPLPPAEPVQGVETDLIAYEWDVTAGGKPLWREQRTAAPLALDSYLREDFGDAEVKVDMLARLAPGVSAGPMSFGSTYTEYASGPPAAVPAVTSRVPASRGAVCTLGSLVADPCPFTDGMLDLVPLSDQAGLPSPSLELTLAAPIRPSLLIMRDVQTMGTSQVQLEGSADGVAWQPIAQFWIGPPYVEGPEPPQISAYDSLVGSMRSVRQPLTPPADPIAHLRLNGLLVTALREISFFE